MLAFLDVDMTEQSHPLFFENSDTLVVPSRARVHLPADLRFRLDWGFPLKDVESAGSRSATSDSTSRNRSSSDVIGPQFRQRLQKHAPIRFKQLVQRFHVEIDPSGVLRVTGEDKGSG